MRGLLLEAGSRSERRKMMEDVLHELQEPVELSETELHEVAGGGGGCGGCGCGPSISLELELEASVCL
jgi:hypothetical protein